MVLVGVPADLEGHAHRASPVVDGNNGSGDFVPSGLEVAFVDEADWDSWRWDDSASGRH